MSVNSSIDRAQFLRGAWRGGRQPLRPPWALIEERFTEVCDGGGRCIAHCPEGILLHGRGGHPEVDFNRGECSFCRECVDGCPTGALQVVDGQAPWTLQARIGDACIAYQGVECRSCGEYCEPRAIVFRLQAGGVARPKLTVTDCTGCGACVKPCPVGAITIHQGPARSEDSVQ
jgi:ferredoxin-type protein NapF